MSETTIHIEEEMNEAKAKAHRWTEEISVAGNELGNTLSRLFKEATVRKITVKNQHGKTILNIPLAVGAVGMVVLGPWSVVGLLAAWLTRCSIIIEHEAVEEMAEKRAGETVVSA
jgi:hypothetical protein